ncbi:MAG: hypothetical protein IKX91_05525, partial [Firmicutes bacterium]|nr:hypothetical protein [Bacillota bacterium]
MTTFWLKIIAMATMVIDHAAIAFFDDALWLRVIGRLAFLIYAFLMAEGFRHYRDDPDRVRKHFLRLTLVMIVSEFACDYFDKQQWVVWSEQSVIPTLWLGLLGIWFYERYKEEGRWLAPIAWGILAWASYRINSQYKVVGVLLIVVFYLYREWAEKKVFAVELRLIHYLLILAAFVVCHVFVEIYPFPLVQFFLRSKTIWPLTFGMLATAVPLALYNG